MKTLELDCHSAITKIAKYSRTMCAFDVIPGRVMPVKFGTTLGRASVWSGSAVLLFREWPRQRTSPEGVKTRAGKAIAAAGGGRDEGDSKDKG